MRDGRDASMTGNETGGGRGVPGLKIGAPTRPRVRWRDPGGASLASADGS